MLIRKAIFQANFFSFLKEYLTVCCELIDENSERPDVGLVWVVVDAEDALWCQPLHERQVLQSFQTNLKHISMNLWYCSTCTYAVFHVFLLSCFDVISTCKTSKFAIEVTTQKNMTCRKFKVEDVILKGRTTLQAYLTLHFCVVMCMFYMLYMWKVEHCVSYLFCKDKFLFITWFWHVGVRRRRGLIAKKCFQISVRLKRSYKTKLVWCS